MYRIERLDGSTDLGYSRSGYFVAVYKGNECLGTCLTDGTLTARECAESVYTNREIDRMERRENERIDRSLNY